MLHVREQLESSIYWSLFEQLKTNLERLAELGSGIDDTITNNTNTQDAPLIELNVDAMEGLAVTGNVRSVLQHQQELRQLNGLLEGLRRKMEFTRLSDDDPSRRATTTSDSPTTLVGPRAAVVVIQERLEAAEKFVLAQLTTLQQMDGMIQLTHQVEGGSAPRQSIRFKDSDTWMSTADPSLRNTTQAVWIRDMQGLGSNTQQLLDEVQQLKQEELRLTQERNQLKDLLSESERNQTQTHDALLSSEARVSQLQQDLITAKALIGDKSNELGALTTQLERAQAARTFAEQNIIRKESALLTLQGSTNESHQQLRAALVQAQTRSTELESQVGNVTHTLASLTAERANLQTALDEAISLRDKTATELGLVKNKLKGTEAELDEKRSLLETQAKQLGAFEDDLVARTSELAEYKAQLEAAHADAADYTHNLELKQADLDASAQVLATERRALSQKQDELAQFQQNATTTQQKQARVFEKRLKEAGEKLADEEAAWKAIEQSLRESEAAVVERSQQLAVARSQVKTQAEQLKTEQVALEEAKARLREDQLELEQLRLQLTLTTAQFRKVSSQGLALQMDLKQKHTLLQAAETARDETEQALEEAHAELATAMSEIESKQKLFAVASARLTTATSELKAKEQELAETKAKAEGDTTKSIQRLTKETKKWSTQVTEAQFALQAEKQKLDMETAALSTANAEIVHRAAEIVRLTRELAAERQTVSAHEAEMNKTAATLAEITDGLRLTKEALTTAHETVVQQASFPTAAFQVYVQLHEKLLLRGEEEDDPLGSSGSSMQDPSIIRAQVERALETTTNIPTDSPTFDELTKLFTQQLMDELARKLSFHVTVRDLSLAITDPSKPIPTTVTFAPLSGLRAALQKQVEMQTTQKARRLAHLTAVASQLLASSNLDGDSMNLAELQVAASKVIQDMVKSQGLTIDDDDDDETVAYQEVLINLFVNTTAKLVTSKKGFWDQLDKFIVELARIHIQCKTIINIVMRHIQKEIVTDTDISDASDAFTEASRQRAIISVALDNLHKASKSLMDNASGNAQTIAADTFNLASNVEGVRMAEMFIFLRDVRLHILREAGPINDIGALRKALDAKADALVDPDLTKQILLLRSYKIEAKAIELKLATTWKLPGDIAFSNRQAVEDHLLDLETICASDSQDVDAIMIKRHITQDWPARKLQLRRIFVILRLLPIMNNNRLSMMESTSASIKMGVSWVFGYGATGTQRVEVWWDRVVSAWLPKTSTTPTTDVAPLQNAFLDNNIEAASLPFFLPDAMATPIAEHLTTSRLVAGSMQQPYQAAEARSLKHQQPASAHSVIQRMTPKLYV